MSAKNPVEALPFSPHKHYNVLAKQERYEGVSAKVKFSGGRSVLWALPKNSPQEKINERLWQFEWLVNNGYQVEEYKPEEPEID